MSDEPQNPGRKPRIAIMGEFSAGKSTLSNLLLGKRVLPEKVTATRLPPIWISQGKAMPMRVSVDREELPVFLETLEDISIEETYCVKIGIDAPILAECDLIDFPGISDPNMSSDVWERLLPEVDCVLWCTHATQAWRQSEAAAWALVPPQVQNRSLLLITRFDKLTNPIDRTRVQMRVSRETEGLFAGVCPISLTGALAAAPDSAEWDASGAGMFYQALSAVIRAARENAEPGTIMALSGAPDELLFAAPRADRIPEPAPVEPPAAVPEHAFTLAPEADESTSATAEAAQITPRRVKPHGMTRTPRPGGRRGGRDQTLSALRADLQEN